MLDKLEKMSEKYTELTTLLSDPKVIENQALYKKYAKNHADLKEIIEKYEDYKKLLTNLEQTKEMLKETGQDIELKELAQEELRCLEETKTQVEEELKRLLIPSDPNDAKNVILEVRAGTGGDEGCH